MMTNRIPQKEMAKTLLVLVFFCLIPATSYAQRYALVIGNSLYGAEIGTLRNPVNDANDMAASLKRKHFTVTTLVNADQRQMERSIAKFTKQLNEKNAVGLFFFAGHGIEVGGRNYLIPINANIQSEADVKYDAVDVGRVMSGMEYAGNNLNIVILDACRNNPFARSFRSASRGLIRMDPPKGSLILYATSPGDVAADGAGRNGLFTQHLLKAMEQPNYTVEQVFKATANKVYKATNKKQLPWQSGVMLGDFYFSNGPLNAQPAQKIVPGPVVRNNQQAEVLFWESIKNETDPAFFISYLEQYPRGIYAGLAKLKAKSYKSKTRFNQAHLTVKSTPKGTRVRILNIVPKYHDGIKLKQGRYQIEVSKPGYQRYLKWISLAREDIVHSVALIENETKVNSVIEKPAQISQSNSVAKDSYTGIEFVTINPGCFQMGSDHGDYDEKPVHRVCITQSYELGKYEVTQAQWKKVMGHNPSRFKGDHNPVEQVSWNDVQDFIRKLNRQTGGNYRLPTEAEWEYACRSGGQEQEYCGSDSINGIAWYDGNSGNTAHPVGQKRANGLGLYDMSGNVWEWVQDWYESDYYDNNNSSTNNPTGSSSGSSRVSRGGSWRYNARYSRSTRRFDDSPDFSLNVLGFRLARTR